MLITSFRSEELANHTGGEAIADPFKEGQWTSTTTTEALDSGGLQAFANSLAVTMPSTIIPITIAASPPTPSRGCSSGARPAVRAWSSACMVVPLQMALIPMLQAGLRRREIFGVQVLPTEP